MKSPERPEPGHSLGTHRVLDDKAKLPQAADRLDNRLPIFSNEILIDVERLNIDAASFVQMEQETKHDNAAIAKIVLENTRTRGKQQNRVTGSGGMLVGTVKQVGSKYRGHLKVKAGDRVATLVSLTLTPLHLEAINKIVAPIHQLEVKGHAILFETGIAALIPDDLPETVSMAVFDVAGAPATVDAITRAGQTLVVIGGGGKAGVLSCVAGRRKVGKKGRVIAVEPSAKAAADLEALGVCDEILQLDATDPMAVRSGVEKATRGKLGNVVVNVASVPDTENSALLCARPRAKVLLFGMATSFTKVALGAEGIACDAQLLFGNGYYPGHDRFSIALLRKHKKLKELFLRRYGG